MGGKTTRITAISSVPASSEPASFLAQLTPAKVQHFAAEARSLDAAEVRNVGPAKRYTLLLCLMARSQVQLPPRR